MPLWIKKDGYNWVKPNNVFIKKDASTWATVKKMWVKASNGLWRLFYPYAGPYTTTAPYISTDTAGNNQPYGYDLIFGSSNVFGQRGVWEANGDIISSYSYKLYTSTSSAPGAQPFTLVTSGSMAGTYQSINLSNNDIDGKYIIFEVMATRSDGVTGSDNTDSQNYRYFVHRDIPVNNYTTLSLSGNNLTYVSSWSATTSELPDVTRSIVKLYRNTTNSTSGGTLVATYNQANGNNASTSSTSYSSTFTYDISSDSNNNGKYFYVVETQYNSGTDWFNTPVTATSTTVFAQLAPVASPGPYLYLLSGDEMTVGATYRLYAGSWTGNPYQYQYWIDYFDSNNSGHTIWNPSPSTSYETSNYRDFTIPYAAAGGYLDILVYANNGVDSEAWLYTSSTIKVGAPTVINNASTTSQWSVNVMYFGPGTGSVVLRYGTSPGSYIYSGGSSNTTGTISPIGPFAANTTYYWQVTPYTGTNGTGVAGTPATGSVSTLPFAPTIINAPTVSPSSGTAGTTTFYCSTGDWTSSPTSYSYQWKYNDQGSLWVSISGATSSSYTPPSNYVSLYQSGLRCYVTATNAGGSSTPSYNSNTVTVSAPVIAPTNNTAPTLTASTLNIGGTLTAGVGTWNNTPTSYDLRIYRGTAGVLMSETLVASGTSTTLTYTTTQADYDSGQRYFRVYAQASNSGGSSIWQAGTEIGPINNNSLPVLSASVSPTSGTAGSTTFIATASATGAPTPTISYLWEYLGTDLSWHTLSTQSSYSPPSNFNTLYPNYAFHCVITATNSVGSASSTTSLTVNNPTIPNATAPTYVSASGGNGTATVSWSGATNATKYRIWWSTSPTGYASDPSTSYDAETTNTSYTFNLTNGTTYYFWVSASNTNSVWTSYSSSPRAQATPTAPPPSGTAPSTPTGLSNSYSGGPTWTGSWSPSSGTATITYYWTLYQSTTSGGSITATASGSTTGTSFTKSMSSANGLWAYFTVYASNSYGNSTTATSGWA